MEVTMYYYPKNKLWLTLAIAASIHLTACSSMDKKECSTANWQQIGKKDALNGERSNHYTDYAEDCNKFGVKVNASNYKKGWDIGIQQFCTREKGWEWGIKGHNYNQTCPARTETTFYNAFQAGRNIYNKKSNIDDLRVKLEGINDQLADGKLSADKRKNLKEKRRELRSEIFIAELDLSSSKREAQKMGFTTY
jgi:hypothetical protein